MFLDAYGEEMYTSVGMVIFLAANKLTSLSMPSLAATGFFVSDADLYVPYDDLRSHVLVTLQQEDLSFVLPLGGLLF